jgi:hypothetical protein
LELLELAADHLAALRAGAQVELLAEFDGVVEEESRAGLLRQQLLQNFVLFGENVARPFLDGFLASVESDLRHGDPVGALSVLLVVELVVGHVLFALLHHFLGGRLDRLEARRDLLDVDRDPTVAAALDQFGGIVRHLVEVGFVLSEIQDESLQTTQVNTKSTHSTEKKRRKKRPPPNRTELLKEQSATSTANLLLAPSGP